MALTRRSSLAATAFCCAALAMAQAPQPAEALNPIGTVCGIGGLISGAVGKACSVGGKVLGVGKKVLGSSGSGGTSRAQAVIGLAAIGAWVLVGAKVALRETANVIAHTTAPHLTTTWFSSSYWRMAGIGAILTLPFLFAAAVQALLHSDLALLMRAAFGYLPLALLAVGIAAPLAMLLLAATDEMCAVVSSAAGNAGVNFLSRAGRIAGALSIVAGSPFLAFLAGLVAAIGAIVLWLELLMREAAVYVIVLMLPLAFAAFVWPARRVWAIRAVELLVALILSKFAIVAVLTLGGAALGQSPYGGISSMLAGGVLVILGAFAPWALVRLLPLAELASGAAGSLRGESGRAGRALGLASGISEQAHHRLVPHRDAVDDDEVVADGSDGAARAETERLAELPAPPVAVAPASRANGAGGLAGSAGGVAGSAGGLAGSTGSLAGSTGGLAGSTGGRADDADRASDSAPATPGAGPRPDESRSERIPGLGPQYQMDDFTWRLHLGLEEGWPPPPVGPFDEDNARPLDADDPPDDHKPLPPAQDPEDGHL